ncbi:MAG TPA: hypothetical protein VHP63_07110 [candidate division Zixibacteria bacterium]|nr:hypothetical protein [candidate division Zixibacteria bacterium]
MRKSLFFSIILSFYLPIAYSILAEDADPVLNYYVSYADTNFVSSNSNLAASKYSFVALTYYKSIGKKGVVTRLDSTVVRYFCSGESVDSSVTLVKSDGKIPELTFLCPNVFIDSFGHGFFPNDTGGRELAISFENISSSDTLPSGIAVIDREEFSLRAAYLFYPNQTGYKRLTRSFRFSDKAGFNFPDSVWEVGAKQGIFSTEYYRLETGIKEIQLLR